MSQSTMPLLRYIWWDCAPYFRLPLWVHSALDGGPIILRDIPWTKQVPVLLGLDHGGCKLGMNCVRHPMLSPTWCSIKARVAARDVEEGDRSRHAVCNGHNYRVGWHVVLLHVSCCGKMWGKKENEQTHLVQRHTCKAENPTSDRWKLSIPSFPFYTTTAVLNANPCHACPACREEGPGEHHTRPASVAGAAPCCVHCNELYHAIASSRVQLVHPHSAVEGGGTTHPDDTAPTRACN